MDAELGDSASRPKRQRSGDAVGFEDAQQVAELLTTVDDSAAEHDEAMESDLPVSMPIDKGKQRMVDERCDAEDQDASAPDDHSRNASVVDDLETELRYAFFILPFWSFSL